jgi:hypothetical protein
MEAITKPKLVFFQWKSEKAPDFLRLHLQQHIKCLSQYFEVVVINENCDYQQICDQYQPDLTLFESGINTRARQRLEIKNTRAYPEIPKLGLHNGDSWCEARAGFLSDMKNWGIETFFSISTTAAEHTPEISENLFVWPNFIDADLYRDYGYQKIIPVLFTGSQMSLYPWRQKIYEIVSSQYPSLICPHHGYNKHSRSRMIYGEQYSRTINASWFVPTCGTVAKEIVRKHFEIPAARSCLITEKTPILEAAGFIDMENCVFAEGSEILDKLDYLFQNLDELEKIINAGYQLVHSSHTLKQRNQIFQWFSLYRNLELNQKIVQTGPFEPLIVVEKLSGIKNSHITCHGLDLVLLAQGNEKLWAGKYDEAEVFYLKCHNYIKWMPEPKLRLALCNLYKGNPENALYWIAQPIKYTLEEYQAIEPDPVEWAYLIISLLCHGKLDEAIKRVNQYPCLNHPELERTRLVINILTHKEDNYGLHHEKSQYHYSVHQMPNRDLNNWVDNLCKMLKACQQLSWVDVLRSTASLELADLKTHYNDEKKSQTEWLVSKKINNSFLIIKKQRINEYLSLLKSRYTYKIKHFLSKLSFKLQIETLKVLHSLEKRFGYFLPYRFSEMQNDEFFHAVHTIIEKEDIKTALLIGASTREGITAAFFAGLQENLNNPTGFCIMTSQSDFIHLQTRYSKKSYTQFYHLLSSLPEDLEQKLINEIEIIKATHKINSFDLVIIDNSELNTIVPLDKVNGAKFIVLDDINTFHNYKNHQKLLEDTNYTLFTQNPSLRNGYSIFKQLNN